MEGQAGECGGWAKDGNWTCFTASEAVPEYPWGREGQDDDELNLGKMEHLTVAVS